PSFAHVDPAEELPVALQPGTHDAVGRAVRKTLEALVQLARAKHGEHHELVEVGAASLDAKPAADEGMAAVASHEIVRFQDIASRSTLLDDRHAYPGFILIDGTGRPSEARFHAL